MPRQHDDQARANYVGLPLNLYRKRILELKMQKIFLKHPRVVQNIARAILPYVAALLTRLKYSNIRSRLLDYIITLAEGDNL